MYDDEEYYKASISRISSLVESGKANTHHFNNLGILFLETGEEDKGISALNKAIELEPGNGIAFKNLGMFCERNNNLELALDYYLKGAKACKRDYSLQLNNAYLLAKLDRHEEAVSFFLKAIKIGFNNEIVSENLALSYQAIGNKDKSEHYKNLAKSFT